MQRPIDRSTLVLGLCLGAALVSTRWVRVNISPSVPYGLYRLTAVQAPLPRGVLVLLPVPASVQPWHSSWVPLLKPVAGMAGDRVCHLDHVLYVNGIDYGRVFTESQGKPVPHIAEGCSVVPPGHVFLASTVPRSLDSRYVGCILVSDLTAQAVPVLTW